MPPAPSRAASRYGPTATGSSACSGWKTAPSPEAVTVCPRPLRPLWREGDYRPRAARGPGRAPRSRYPHRIVTHGRPRRGSETGDGEVLEFHDELAGADPGKEGIVEVEDGGVQCDGCGSAAGEQG